MSAEERRMLERLAERQGVSASDVLRLWIRERYAEAFGSEAPKKRK